MTDASDQFPLSPAVRAGDATVRNDALLPYRAWLYVLARMEIDKQFHGKFDASDIVQQTMLEAVRGLSKFRGGSEGELMAWLRQVLAHVMTHEVRRYRGTQRRDLKREVSLDASLAESSQRLCGMLAAKQTSPSGRAVRNENEAMLARVLANLPPDYREVIILRNLQGLPHDEVAARMNRSGGAVRMLWVRALAQLREDMENHGADNAHPDGVADNR